MSITPGARAFAHRIEAVSRRIMLSVGAGTGPHIPAGADRISPLYRRDSGAALLGDVPFGNALARGIDSLLADLRVSAAILQNRHTPGSKRFEEVTSHDGSKVRTLPNGIRLEYAPPRHGCVGKLIGMWDANGNGIPVRTLQREDVVTPAAPAPAM
jgi:hypothetical protein